MPASAFGGALFEDAAPAEAGPAEAGLSALPDAGVFASGLVADGLFCGLACGLTGAFNGVALIGADLGAAALVAGTEAPGLPVLGLPEFGLAAPDAVAGLAAGAGALARAGAGDALLPAVVFTVTVLIGGAFAGAETLACAVTTAADLRLAELVF